MIKKWTMILSFLLIAVLLVGCTESDPTDGDGGNGEIEDGDPETANEEIASDEPVTLHVYDINAGISEEVFDELFVGPVGEAHPTISFEHTAGGHLGGLEEMMAAREVPDIITVSFNQLNNLLNMELLSNLQPLAEENQLDLSRFNPILVEMIEEFGQEEEFYGIPFSMNQGVLLYNKDIFDLFGADYLSDGMTWQEILEVASQLSGERSGQQYIGMAPHRMNNIVRAYGLPLVDEDTEEVVIATEPYSEGYSEIFALVKDMFELPGVIDEDGNVIAHHMDTFMNQTVAISPDWIAAATNSIAGFEEAGLNNWDVVSWPVFEHAPDLGRQADFHVMVIPPTSENREAAFQVIETLTSDENQREMNSGARQVGTRVTVLDEPEMRLEYGSEFSQYDDRNIEGVFSVEPFVEQPMTPYTDAIYSMIWDTGTRMGVEDLDVNTALRIAQEEAEIIVQEIKQQQ